jgi:hypothetical protein
VNNTLSNIKKISIGLDVSKKTISVFIPVNNLDLEIENSLKGFRKLSSKLKKLYKKEYEDLVFVYEPTGSYSELLKKFCGDKEIKSLLLTLKDLVISLNLVPLLLTNTNNQNQEKKNRNCLQSKN